MEKSVIEWVDFAKTNKILDVFPDWEKDFLARLPEKHFDFIFGSLSEAIRCISEWNGFSNDRYEKMVNYIHFVESSQFYKELK